MRIAAALPSSIRASTMPRSTMFTPTPPNGGAGLLHRVATEQDHIDPVPTAANGTQSTPLAAAAAKLPTWSQHCLIGDPAQEDDLPLLTAGKGEDDPLPPISPLNTPFRSHHHNGREPRQKLH